MTKRLCVRLTLAWHLLARVFRESTFYLRRCQKVKGTATPKVAKPRRLWQSFSLHLCLKNSYSNRSTKMNNSNNNNCKSIVSHSNINLKLLRR